MADFNHIFLQFIAERKSERIIKFSPYLLK